MRAPLIHFKVEQIKSTDPSFKPALVIVQVRIAFLDALASLDFKLSVGN